MGRFMTELEHSERTLARQGLSERVPIATEVPALLERDIQGPVLQTLNFHPRVAFAWRSNSGKLKLGERWMAVNFKGCSDILGMLKGGKLLAVECKRVGEKPTPEQQSFLDQVNQSGGLGICVHSVAELYEKLPR